MSFSGFGIFFIHVLVYFLFFCNKIFHQIMYVGTVIFGPATALSVVTGIDDWAMILICASVGTIYTAIGGTCTLGF